MRTNGLGVFLIAATAWVCGPALADGTLFDTGVLDLSFADASGSTPISGENDGNFIYTTSGGSSGGQRFARYNLDGSLDGTFASGIDFRGIFTNNNRDLFAKEFGSGNIYSLTPGGQATLLFTLNDPETQTSAGFSGDDSELYTRDGDTVRRYNATNGNFLGSFALQGLSVPELLAPARWQMETSLTGRIFTYAAGVVSEWDLAGNRIGSSTIPIGSPSGFPTTWSFGFGGDDRVYLFDETAGASGWRVYDIGVPEPGTLSLLAMGVLAMIRRRR